MLTLLTVILAGEKTLSKHDTGTAIDRSPARYQQSGQFPRLAFSKVPSLVVQ